MKPRILWAGDACVPTGFARANRNIIEQLLGRFDIAILGVNANGDPHDWPVPVFPARTGGDLLGYGRFGDLVKKGEPDVILIHSDPWIIAQYLRIARKMREAGRAVPPIVGYMPIDSPGTKRVNAEMLNDLSLGIFYTDFALSDARRAGFTGRGMSIPLGVDLDVYHPEDKAESREAVFTKPDGKATTIPLDCYLLGNVNRNQWRKRFDLSIAYFAKWVKEFDRRDAYLYFHAAVVDIGWDLLHLADYYGVSDRVVLSEMTPRDGTPENEMRYVYSALDLHISTTTGEGWGLSTAESLACGVPNLVPEYSALAEWAKDAVRFVPVTGTVAHVGQESNCIGGVVDELDFVDSLEELYGSRHERDAIGRAGRARMMEPQYRWEAIGERFAAALDSVLGRNIESAAA